MVKLSGLISTLDMYEYVRIVIMKESLQELYKGKLSKMPLMTYMQVKNMSVCIIETATVEEEVDCYTTFLNITVKDVER